MPEKRIATVTQVNTYIKSLLDGNAVLSNIWVRGEISNFKQHYTGHCYLTLKDENSVLKAVMFRSASARLLFRPVNGMKVIAHGRISVFERDGQYQLYIEEMQPDGIGDLHIAFEQLKEKLKAEGLFDMSRKKKIPAFPRRIGVITSSTGAAIRDILNILGRRYKLADIYIYPVMVQGEQASGQIVEAIEYFNRENAADVLIVGRGGGSIEDLWAFNEERTARAVAASRIPIISAVGHETDFTICDFVADLRAPTPSAAAELVAPSSDEVAERIRMTDGRLRLALSKLVENKRQALLALSQSSALVRFSRRIDDARILIDRASSDLLKSMNALLSSGREKLAKEAARLDALSPLAVLKRGYAIALDAEGKTIKSEKDVKKGDYIKVRLREGAIDCEVL